MSVLAHGCSYHSTGYPVVFSISHPTLRATWRFELSTIPTREYFGLASFDDDILQVIVQIHRHAPKLKSYPVIHSDSFDLKLQRNHHSSKITLHNVSGWEPSIAHTHEIHIEKESFYAIPPAFTTTSHFV